MKTNIRAIESKDATPEATLRDALSVISAARAREEKPPGAIVLLVRDGFLPDLTYCGIDQNQLAVAAVFLQRAACEAIDLAVFEYAESDQEGGA